VEIKHHRAVLALGIFAQQPDRPESYKIVTPVPACHSSSPA
jgi:hypothetical protein